MTVGSRPKVHEVVARWLFGAALVTWRYLWETTPLHRVEEAGELPGDLPPEVDDAVVDDDVQLARDGVGPMFHRRFLVRVVGATLTAEDLLGKVGDDFGHFVPSEVVTVEGDAATSGRLRVGDELLVKMPGPWDGPVRVVHADDTCLRLATLRGHLEAGQVQFRAYERDGLLHFEVEAWARPATRLVNLLYTRLRLAKEIQLNMWVRFCLAAGHTAGGRRVDGVHIHTRSVGWSDEVSASALP